METTISDTIITNERDEQGLHRDEPDLKHRAGEAAQQVGETIKVNAKEALAKARHSTMEVIDDQKKHFAERVRSLEKTMADAASKLRQEEGSNALSQGADNLAHRVASIADYLERTDFEEMAGDAREMIRRHPAVSFGAMFAAGLFIGRFLKATEPAPRSMSSEPSWQETPIQPSSPMTGSQF